MSLINKMLQDLDARGTPAAESFPSQIRPVAQERQALAARFSPKAIAAIAAGTLGGLALAWFLRVQYHHAHTADKPAAPASEAVTPASAAMRPEQGMSSTIMVGPAPLPAAETPAAAAPTPPAQVKALPAAAAPAATPAATAVGAADLPAPAARKHQHESPPQGAPAAAVPPKSVAPFEPDSDEARAARQAIMAELQTRMSAGAITHEGRRARKAAAPAAQAGVADAGDAAARGKRGLQGRQESGSQRAEGEYRRALASLQDGRMTETVAALEQALRLDPGHDAARQTLVGLLIEAKRLDEAMRYLQAGLALDPRQPALAMLLARLQIEGGGSGIETLMRSLPYAGNDPGKSADYHAFLAGALERQQRHHEAAEQYQAALRAAPGNGVWWMGLGMSLQADKRNAEAIEAFQRARSGGTLSPELQSFVERRLQQLGR